MAAAGGAEFEGVVPIGAEVPAFAAFKAELAAELAAEPWCGFPELTGDIRLLRYLRSREADVAEAALAFRAHLAWRKANDVDAIRQKIVAEGIGLDWSRYPRGAEVEQCCPQVLNAGFSRDGHLVQLDNMGLVTPQAVTGKQGMGLEAFSVAIIYMLEVRNKLQDDLSREKGQMIRTVQIRDMMQVTAGMVTANKKVATAIMSMAGDNYPESIDKMIFINAGSAFKVLMSTFKAIAPPRTVARFVTLKENTEPELLNYVTMDSVQQFCNQGNLAAVKCRGEPNVSSGGGVLTIPARAHSDAFVSMAAGQTCRWSWSVAKDDMNFTVHLLADDKVGWRKIDSGAAMGELVPCGVAVDGAVEAGGLAAVVRLRWDNSHGWTSKKVVTYSAVVEAVPPVAQVKPVALAAASASVDEQPDMPPDSLVAADAPVAEPEPVAEPAPEPAAVAAAEPAPAAAEPEPEA